MNDTADEIVSTHSVDFWRTIASHALRALRPFIKLSGEQSAAWDVVSGILGDA